MECLMLRDRLHCIYRSNLRRLRPTIDVGGVQDDSTVPSDCAVGDMDGPEILIRLDLMERSGLNPGTHIKGAFLAAAERDRQ